MRYDGNIRTENRRGRRNMTDFIASPMFARWFLRHPPQRSLLLCSPFLRGGTLERVLEFVGFPELRPEMELKVLFRGLKRDFLQGASDLAAVELLRRMERQCGGRVEVRLLDNLHMKAYLVDGKQLLISSGNCTSRGFERTGTEGNVEGGIATDDPTVVADFLSYFDSVYAAALPLSARVGEYLDPEFQDQVLRASAHLTAGERRHSYAVPRVSGPSVPAGEREERDTGIPQHYTPEAMEQTLRFLYGHRGAPASATKTRLAQVLGSRAVKQSDRNRKLYGVLKNLQLLGLAQAGRMEGETLPALTPLGIRYMESGPEERRKLLRRRVLLLPWFSEVMELDPEGRPSGQALLDYLCRAYGYKPSSAKRYVPAIKHMLAACGFGEED